jgi:hypothetical protein
MLSYFYFHIFGILVDLLTVRGVSYKFSKDLVYLLLIFI